MSATVITGPQHFPVSKMAEELIGSEIIRLANDINEKIKAGARISNFTIGDFDPKIFPIPSALEDEIIIELRAHQTNYPAANGVVELRKAVSAYVSRTQQLDYTPNEILIAGGARPLIYAVYTTLIDAGDEVIFPVPSWNNNHYCHLAGAKPVAVEASPKNRFMPTADDLRPYIRTAKMIALCSPQNPTGTVFTAAQLHEISVMVLEENRRRDPSEKPLYLMYDQIYSALDYSADGHVDPVSLCPELRPYTIYIDGLSKAFAATGVRVGWAFGPEPIMEKMKSILSHIGAWAPKAEQVATATFLNNTKELEKYMESFRPALSNSLHAFYEGFERLRKQGYAVNCIEPEAAIYLTIQFDLKGKRTGKGEQITTTEDITNYLLDEAGMAVVPFYAFGAAKTSTWYRLSIGTCRIEEIPAIINRLENALSRLS